MTESEAIKEIRFNMSTIGLSDKAAKRVVEARDMAINALEKQMTKKVDKTEIEISKRKFATELKQLVHQKCVEINHYVSGCNSPFSYLQIADVQESLREIENTLNIKIKE